MELFYSPSVADGCLTLEGEESNHCIRVLRHRRGDVIHVIDGLGTLYECEITDDNAKNTSFRIVSRTEGYGAHPYHLHIAVAPPKNIDRFEWFAEKATEIGVDEISPVFGDCSERKVFKPERVGRIIISAAKQSQKGAVPVLSEACSVRDFILSHKGDDALKMICYCGETDSLGVPKKPITRYLAAAAGKPVTVMIGPEGDFSRSEVALALECGFKPVSLGESRLRIETAAVTAVAAVYLNNV